MSLSFDPLMAFYALPLALVWAVYFGVRKNAERRSVSKRQAAAEAGLLEPPSLHPEIDPIRLHRLRRLRARLSGGRHSRPDRRQGRPGRAVAVHRPRRLPRRPVRATPSPSSSARRSAASTFPMSAPTSRPTCPASTSPASSAAWASSATPSSRAARRSSRCARLDRTRATARLLDVVIVGGGPAGLSASLAAMQHKLRFVTVEQDTLRRHGRAFPARQAGDDRARHAAAGRQGQVQGGEQGEAARRSGRSSRGRPAQDPATANASKALHAGRRPGSRSATTRGVYPDPLGAAGRSAAAARRASSTSRARSSRRSSTG